MNSELMKLRKQIDRYDEELVEVLSRRFAITAKVGQLKAKSNTRSIDPDREKQQFARIQKLAKERGISPDLANLLLRNIIDQVVADHEAMKLKAMPAISKTKKPKVGIIGMGDFGSLAANSLQGLCTVSCFDINRKLRANNLAEVMQSDFVILAVPLSAIEPVLNQIKPLLKRNTTLIDVCSVKQKPIEIFKQVLPHHKNIVFTHPLFGPQSTVNGIAGHTVILCDANSKAAKNVRKFCKRSVGLKTVSMSARDHDLMMANMHALTFFVARGLNNFGLKSSRFQAPSFQMLLDLAKLDKVQSQDLFETVECGNIFAKGIRRRFVQEMQKLNSELT